MKHFTTIITAMIGAFDFLQSKPLQSVIYICYNTAWLMILLDIYSLALGLVHIYQGKSLTAML